MRCGSCSANGAALLNKLADCSCSLYYLIRLWFRTVILNAANRAQSRCTQTGSISARTWHSSLQMMLPFGPPMKRHRETRKVTQNALDHHALGGFQSRFRELPSDRARA